MNFWSLFRRNNPRNRLTDHQESHKKEIETLAYLMWEKEGKPANSEHKYWLKAEKEVNRPQWQKTLIKTERKLEKWLAFLKSLAILEILGILGNITIVIALLGFILTERQRRDAEVYQAWQVITAAYDQTGSGGRIKAIEFLNSRPIRFPWIWLRWERESLSGLAAPKAYLREIKLPNADLERANLQDADLERANLQDAVLEGTNLQDADLERANLQDAVLDRANLQNANLGGANLQNAYLEEANLQDSFLFGANLQNAYLEKANLQNAYLDRANLQDAVLDRANLQNAYLEEANLQNAYLDRANLQGADLEGANLQDANLGEAKITPKQIKLTCNWEKAKYKRKWSKEKQRFILNKPENQEFIEKMKQDKSSDPQRKPDCRIFGQK